MRKRIISMLFVLSAFIVPASVQAQWGGVRSGQPRPGYREQCQRNSGDLGNGAECPLHMEARPQRFSSRGVIITTSCAK